MKANLVHEQSAARTFLLIFDPGDTFLQPMIDFVRSHDIKGASFTGLGALSEATIAWFDPADAQYKPIQVAEQVECVGMTGNVSWMNGKPFIHAHCVLGRRDGSTVAGHVKELKARPTLEITLTEHTAGLERKKRPDTGYALLE